MTSSPFLALPIVISRICQQIGFKLLLSIYGGLLKHSPSHDGGRGFESGRVHYMIDFFVDDIGNKMGVISSIVQTRNSARGKGGVGPGSQPGFCDASVWWR